MSSWTAELRRQEAARKRGERAFRQRQKELGQIVKTRAKLSELERWRLEVEIHENSVEELLSVHKEQSEPLVWAAYGCAPCPYPPVPVGRQEFFTVLDLGTAPRSASAYDGGAVIEEARLSDREDQERAQANYKNEVAEWQRMRALAKRVLEGQPQAYSEAIADFSPFSQIGTLGSSMHFTVHSPKLIACVLTVNGREVIPGEMKSLTATGKLSVKSMPKARFHEIYQDHVCGCALRVAREILALLPVDIVLVTASVNGRDSRTGNSADLPVLSIGFDRTTIERLNFERLDPSDAVDNFVHRGDAKTSRKSGEFLPIVPLTAEEMMPAKRELMDLSKLLTDLRLLRAEVGALLKPSTDNDALKFSPPA